MANLRETAAWESGIYQLETTDPVVGGADGISNKQAIQLANRTGYLKGEVEALKSSSLAALASKRDISDSYSKTQTAALIAPKLDSAIAEATYLRKTDKIDAYTKAQSDALIAPKLDAVAAEATYMKKIDKIDAYTKAQSDEKYALKIDMPAFATEAKAGIVKLKNGVTGKAQDAAVTEKAVSDLVEAKMNGVITDDYAKLPGGLIIQWGVRKPPNHGGKTLFPIAYPNKCLHVMVILFGSSIGQATNEQLIQEKDNTGFTRFLSSWPFSWFAIGY